MDPKNPQGEQLVNPAGSQPEIITADEGDQVRDDLNPALEPSPEEVAFNNLKGSTQARIRTLAQKANLASSYEQELERVRQENEALKLRGMAPAMTVPASNPDVADAISKLDKFGVATKDFVSKQVDERVNQSLQGLVWNMEMDRLEGRHTGADGLPSFDREEYQAFINANPQYRNYQPEDVYNKMYEDEIFDAKVKSLGHSPASTQAPTIRGTRTRVQEETMTPEYIERRLQQPDGRAWYDQNIDKINSVLGTLQAPSTE